MRPGKPWKLLLPALAAGMLAGCPSPPRPAPPPAGAAINAPAASLPHLGAPYEVLPQASLLTILVYRGGALASAGHNHVIASHDLRGTIYVAAARLQSSFELHVPVGTLTVDEAALRAQQPAADFPADISDGAREGTRHNMLGDALLDAAQHPEITLRSLQLEPAGDPADPATVVARTACSVRGQERSFALRVHYVLSGNDTVEVSGELPLRQTELGLRPFSAMLGALQVQDEMHVSFHIVARAAALRRAP